MEKDTNAMILHLRDVDVLCGSGTKASNHPGNKRFRAIVASHYGKYSEATNKAQKMSTIKRVLADVLVCDPSTRFLKKDPIFEWFYIATSRVVRDKISHMLRQMKSAEQTRRVTSMRQEDLFKDSKNPTKTVTDRNKKIAVEEDSMNRIGGYSVIPSTLRGGSLVRSTPCDMSSAVLVPQEAILRIPLEYNMDAAVPAPRSSHSPVDESLLQMIEPTPIRVSPAFQLAPTAASIATVLDSEKSSASGSKVYPNTSSRDLSHGGLPPSLRFLDVLLDCNPAFCNDFNSEMFLASAPSQPEGEEWYHPCHEEAPTHYVEDYAEDLLKLFEK